MLFDRHDSTPTNNQRSLDKAFPNCFEFYRASTCVGGNPPDWIRRGGTHPLKRTRRENVRRRLDGVDATRLCHAQDRFTPVHHRFSLTLSLIAIRNDIPWARFWWSTLIGLAVWFHVVCCEAFHFDQVRYGDHAKDHNRRQYPPRHDDVPNIHSKRKGPSSDCWAYRSSDGAKAGCDTIKSAQHANTSGTVGEHDCAARIGEDDGTGPDYEDRRQYDLLGGRGGKEGGKGN